MDLAKRLFKGDRVVWIIFVILCLYSLVFVFSATSTIVYKNDNYLAPILRHATFLLTGFLFGVLVLHNIPYRFFKLLGLGLPIAFALLIITMFFGVEINGEPRWLEIMGIQFQPSELAKLSLISFIALVLSKRSKFTDKQIFNYILIGTLAICGAIFTTNGSTAIILFALSILMMFVGQVSMKRLTKLCGGLFLLLILFIATLRYAPDAVIKVLPDRVSTWKGRIERFMEPQQEIVIEPGKTWKIDDDEYQVVHAKIAIAKGGVIGKGPGYGAQRDFLPQAYSDFIYAIILEEGGLIAGLFLLFVYLSLMVRVGMIANKCKNLYPKYLVLGCGLLLGLQALTNMAVAVNLIPVTGQPLPLISRGGTSTVISCVYIGIILSVSRFGANIGNEKDELPAENEATPALPANLSEEEISNWVPGVSSTFSEQKSV